MNRQGVPAVGEASLPRLKSGKGFPSHNVTPCTFADLWVIVVDWVEREWRNRRSNLQAVRYVKIVW